MSDKDWFDDFMEYKLSTSSDDDDSTTPSSSNSGCLPWVIGVFVVLWIISKLFA